MELFFCIVFDLHYLCIAKVIILFEMRRKININYILGACALVLFLLCILSIITGNDNASIW